jgi:hypothetical protein
MIRRCLLVILALLAAVIFSAALFFLIAIAAGLFGLNDFHSIIAIGIDAVTRMPGMVVKMALAAALAALPIAGAMVLFEVFKVRTWVWYAAAAVFLALAGYLIYELLFVRYVPPQLDVPPLFVPGTPLMVLLIISTFAGSLVYWLAAGRHAGAWRR